MRRVMMTFAVACTAQLVLTGCGDSGTPSVSSTMAEATVHGTVKYKGEPVTGGTVNFDPSNKSRPGAKSVSAPIGKDGTYKVTTLQGANSVRCDLPAELLKKDPMLAAAQKQYDVPSGDSTFDIDVDK